MLKQQQTFLTNLQSIFISSRQTHSMGSSGLSRQGTNDMSAGPSGSSRQGTNTLSLNINQDKSYHHQAGDKRKYPSDNESYDDDDDDDDDDRLSVTAGQDFDVTVDGEDNCHSTPKRLKREKVIHQNNNLLRFVTKSGVIRKTMTNLRQNLKVFLFLRIALL